MKTLQLLNSHNHTLMVRSYQLPTVRLTRNPEIPQQAIVQHLTTELVTINPFITIYRTAKERRYSLGALIKKHYPR